MAKKNKQIHGVSPAPPPPVIRWLGAYGYGSDVASVAAFEVAPTRPVSAEPCWDGESRLTRQKPYVKVGLLVDTTSTTLVRAWASDAWTPSTSNGATFAERSAKIPSVRHWDQVAGLKSGKRYGEVLIASPKYTAIVCRDKSAYAFAAALADILELPVISLEDIKM